MKYNFLGRTGVRVSALALGTATFGVAPLDEDSGTVIGRALDAGINFFDTANSYGNQSRFDRPGVTPAPNRRWAEEMLGDALQGHRHDVIIASKVQEKVGEGPNDAGWSWGGGRHTGGLSRVHVMRQIENTLRRLKTDYIDVYYFHHPDVGTPIDQTLRAMDDLVKQGKIRYPALSTYNSGQMVEALWMADRYNLNPPVCHQHAYNLISRGIEREIVPFCLKYGLTLNLFSPLHGGLLASPSVIERTVQGSQRWGGAGFSEADIAKAQKLYALAGETGIPAPHLALAWLLNRPAVSTAIIGPETLAELDANLPAADLELPADLMERVDEVGREPAAFGFPGGVAR